MKTIMALLLCLVLLQSGIAAATKDIAKAKNQADEPPVSQYTFSWPFLEKG
jgi:hypothetical protein